MYVAPKNVARWSAMLSFSGLLKTPNNQTSAEYLLLRDSGKQMEEQTVVNHMH